MAEVAIGLRWERLVESVECLGHAWIVDRS